MPPLPFLKPGNPLSTAIRGRPSNIQATSARVHRIDGRKDTSVSHSARAPLLRGRRRDPAADCLRASPRRRRHSPLAWRSSVGAAARALRRSFAGSRPRCASPPRCYASSERRAYSRPRPYPGAFPPDRNARDRRRIDAEKRAGRRGMRDARSTRAEPCRSALAWAAARRLLLSSTTESIFV